MKNLLSIFLLIAIAIITGCQPAFEITTSQDKFTAENEPIIVSGKSNKLTAKSITDGVYFDEKGFFLNPYIAVDQKTNKIIEAGFFVMSKVYEPNQGFRPIAEVIFIVDGNRFAADVNNQQPDFDIGNWNSISKEYNTLFVEGGHFKLPLDDFESIFTANKIEIKIVGGTAELIVNREDITSSFYQNMNKFHQEMKKYM